MLVFFERVVLTFVWESLSIVRRFGINLSYLIISLLRQSQVSSGISVCTLFSIPSGKWKNNRGRKKDTQLYTCTTGLLALHSTFVILLTLEGAIAFEKLGFRLAEWGIPPRDLMIAIDLFVSTLLFCIKYTVIPFASNWDATYAFKRQSSVQKPRKRRPFSSFSKVPLSQSRRHSRGGMLLSEFSLEL